MNEIRDNTIESTADFLARMQGGIQFGEIHGNMCYANGTDGMIVQNHPTTLVGGVVYVNELPKPSWWVRLWRCAAQAVRRR